MPGSRSSGVLLHLTSLPGPHGSGDLGADAFRFVDWLARAGQGLWQVLPIGGIGPGNSPYMSCSAFAGNPMLIDLRQLVEAGWLTREDLGGSASLPAGRVDFAAMVPWRSARLRLAARRFGMAGQAADRAALAHFRTLHADWLEDYALFMALAGRHVADDWSRWPDALARREPGALRMARAELAEELAFHVFCQWQFFTQWGRLKAHAHARGVRIVGDIPIFIAYHSADVWAHPELFELDSAGRPSVVAGCPPDAFSASGQHWGNPLYRWEVHAREGYQWWIERVRRTVALVDLVRIDHFIGFTRYWEIPAAAPGAEHGVWRAGPGDALFEALHAALGEVAIIAEDLGAVTPAVVAMRERFGYPGMLILQQAFGPMGNGDFLPHAHREQAVVYTGTHDNDTVQGWWQQASAAERADAAAYLGAQARTVHWDMVRACCASVAALAIFPMQDLLGLGSAARMNRPGEGSGWWEWRFRWTELPRGLAARLARLGATYRRNGCRPAQRD